MSISPTLLAVLADPAMAAMSDADAATSLSTPTYTPLTTRITLTSLGAAWGAARAAAVYQTLRTIGVSSDPNAPLCSLAADILAGPGFDATNPQSQATIAILITAGICTEAEAQLATCSVSYSLGAPVAAADVTAARAVLPNYQTLEGYRARLDSARQQIDAAETQLLDGDNPTIPAWADLGAS